MDPASRSMIRLARHADCAPEGTVQIVTLSAERETPGTSTASPLPQWRSVSAVVDEDKPEVLRIRRGTFREIAKK
jgi:hypothetical protein